MPVPSTQPPLGLHCSASAGRTEHASVFLWAQVSGTDRRLEASSPGCSAPRPLGGVPCARAARPLSLLQLLKEPLRRGFGGLNSTWNIQLLLLIATAVWDFRRRACVWRGWVCGSHEWSVGDPGLCSYPAGIWVPRVCPSLTTLVSRGYDAGLPDMDVPSPAHNDSRSHPSQLRMTRALPPHPSSPHGPLEAPQGEIKAPPWSSSDTVPSSPANLWVNWVGAAATGYCC